MKTQISLDGFDPAQMPKLFEGGRTVILNKPKGNSMLPFIRGGVDSVKLREPKSLEVGNIVLARFGGRYLVHRIIAIDGTKVTLMGDGNLRGLTEEGDVSEVLGVVDEIILPNGRHRKPGKGWIWRKLLPVRKYLLKAYRKWNKIFVKVDENV